MKEFLAACSLILPALSCQAAEKAPGALPRSRPEAQGVSSSAILAFVDEAENKIDALHSFLLVRHGQVVAECWWNPYDANTRHELYSLSKSFTSTAVGLAIAEGKLSVDDPVLKFFPEDAPSQPSGQLKAMRVHDLLRMSTGHQSEPSLAASKEPWVKTFLAHPVPYKPGTHFLYNTAATYMLSAIVQKATGQTVLDYLRPRLFEPLGMDKPTWGSSPQGITLGGYGLNVHTEDIARFGQLYLQKGRWQGKQLVPTAWVEAATARQTSNGSNPLSDWDQGYGYQFWRCRHGVYRGDGAFGQFCIVLPEQDAVIAITSGTRDMQAVLNLIWDKLLPAMQREPLPADADSNRKLEARLKNLTLSTPKESKSARLPAGVSGKRYRFPTNENKLESLTLEAGEGDGPVTLVCRFNGGDPQRITCGKGEWKKGRWVIGSRGEQAAAACGAWTADGVYTARICLRETPFVLTLRLHFLENELRLDWSWNVSFGGGKKVQLVGKPDLERMSTLPLSGHTQEIKCAAFSRDGKLAATACYKEKVRVFDVQTGKVLHTFPSGEDVDNKPDNFGVRTQGSPSAIAFGPASKKIAAVGENNSLSPGSLATVFDLTTKRAIFTSRPHRGEIRAAAFSPDGKILVTAGHDGTLKVFEVASGEEAGTFKGHDWVVTAVTFAPKGNTVASVCCNSRTRSIRLWNPLTLRESLNIPLPKGIFHIHDLQFSPDGKQIAGISNWRFHAWDANNGKQLADAGVDQGLFTRLAYAPDGKRIAIAGRQGGGDGKGILRLYDFTTKKVSLVFVEDVGKELIAVSWPVEDKILAVGRRGRTAKLVTVHLKK